MIVRNGKQQGGGWWRESVMEALLDLPSGDGLRSDRKRNTVTTCQAWVETTLPAGITEYTASDLIVGM